MEVEHCSRTNEGRLPSYKYNVKYFLHGYTMSSRVHNEYQICSLKVQITLRIILLAAVHIICPQQTSCNPGVLPTEQLPESCLPRYRANQLASFSKKKKKKKPFISVGSLRCSPWPAVDFSFLNHVNNLLDSLQPSVYIHKWKISKTIISPQNNFTERMSTAKACKISISITERKGLLSRLKPFGNWTKRRD